MNARTDSTITKEQMLTCPGVMPAPRNQWYVAALSSEVSRKVMTRQILDDHVVFFRTEDGTAVALADRCPHRGVPLSMGTVQGNGIRCAYHGFEFGKAGICTHIPSQTTIVDQLAVRSYPLFEVGSYIWIWMGLPAERDDSLLPDMYALGLTRPGYKVTPLFVMEIGCNFQMLHENLLDTSHITFLHPGMIDGGNMAKASFNTSYKNGRVTISRDITETPTAMMARTFHLKHADNRPVKRTLVTDAIPPHLSVITNIFTYPDEPDAPEHILINPQGVTPSGKNRCFNFMVVSSSYQDEQPPDAIPHIQKLVEQDKVVLEAVQKRFDEEGWDLPEISVRADAAALNFRKKMAALVEEERRRLAPKALQSA
jgi:phenylpropionate dioxygenase-like ring-hydroxylating dioxygenase large terminal subunit